MRGVKIALVLGMLTMPAAAEVCRCSHCRSVTRFVEFDRARTFFLLQPASYGAPQYKPPAVAAREQQAQQKTDQIAGALAELVNQVANISNRLANLERNGSGPPPPPQPPEDPRAAAWRVIRQRCGSCHDGPETRGSFDLGELLEPDRLDLAIAFVKNRKMPLDQNDDPAQLSDADHRELVSALEALEVKK